MKNENSNKKNILFVSPDLSLCASLLMYFYDKYSVTTTTDFNRLEKLLHSDDYDLLVLDSEPTDKIKNICSGLCNSGHCIPTILTYVYQDRYEEMENGIKKYVSAVFYKPFDLTEVSREVDKIILSHNIPAQSGN